MVGEIWKYAAMKESNNIAMNVTTEMLPRILRVAMITTKPGYADMKESKSWILGLRLCNRDMVMK